MMGEVIGHAKANGRTAHVTCFVLEDAFGSVYHDHELIPICMDRMHLPVVIRDYMGIIWEVKG